MWRTESRPDHQRECECDQCTGFPFRGPDRVELKAVLDLAHGDRVEICSEFSDHLDAACVFTRFVKGDGTAMAIGVYVDLVDAMNASADVVSRFGMSLAKSGAALEAERLIDERAAEPEGTS